MRFNVSKCYTMTICTVEGKIKTPLTNCAIAIPSINGVTVVLHFIYGTYTVELGYNEIDGTEPKSSL